MAEYNAPLYELFASLGLDASPLIEGLGKAEIDMRDFQGKLNSFALAMERAFEAGAMGALAFQAAVNQAERALGSQAAAAEYLATTMNALVAEHDRAIEANRLEAISIQATNEMSAQRAELLQADMASQREYQALKGQINREELAAFTQHQAIYDEQVLANQAALDAEAASRIEYTQLIQQLEAEQLAAEEAEFAGYMAMLQERRAASRAAMNEERYLFQQQLEQRRAAQATDAVSSAGYASVGLRMGASGIYPTLRAGMSGLGEAIAPLFPVLMAGAFVDILYHELEAVGKLTDEWTGFGVAQKKAWEEAFSGAERARIKNAELIAEWEKAKATAKKGAPLTRSEETGIDKHEVSNLTRDITGARDQVSTLNAELHARERESTSSPIGMANKLLRWALGGKDEETVKKERDETEASITAMTEKRGAIERRILEDVDKKEKSERKMHDRVHEYSERLPWFMGQNPATTMLQQFGFGPQPVITNGGHMPSPPSSDFYSSSHRASEGSSGSIAGSSAPKVSTTSGSGIVVHNTYAPVFKFDGIPADLADFMRNKAEPMLIEDMAHNAHGVTEAIIKVLKDKGVRVG